MNWPDDWNGLKQIIVSSLDGVFVDPERYPADIPKWIAESTFALNVAADKCVMAFIENGAWPSVEGDLRFMLYLRSLFAADMLLSRARRVYRRPSHGTGKGNAMSFLTLTWYRERHRWAAANLSVAGLGN